MNKYQYSATEIFQRLQDYELAQYGSSKIHLPTDEQIAIIEADPSIPSVVIAGAGSGKTETMGARVLWLVANGIVRPDQILGLTFTRKAAGELALRIRRRLRLLQASGLLPKTETGTALDLSVTVSTYHSYAGRVLSEHAIRLGIDAGSDPIGEAALWQVTNNIVSNFESSEFELNHSVATIVDHVTSLSGELGEHHVTSAELKEFLQQRLDEYATISSAKSNQVVQKAIDTIKERLTILPMVEALEAHRQLTGNLSFNDQMNLAAQLVTEFGDIGAQERTKFQIVLLDEYQDTSYSQVRFLSHLFSQGHPVMAVGDPNQAIYGWRSASPETLESFPKHFPATGEQVVPRYKLLTTWRNDLQILTLANRIIDEIALRQAKVAQVDRLQLRPGAGPGFLSSALLEDATSEAKYLATEIAKLWNDPARIALAEKDRSTFAILIRSRSQIPELEEALRDLQIPVDVVGLGGLIHVPEIADIIALLRVITFADAGSSLIRLLTGPRLALGAKDLAALGSFARALGGEEGRSRTSSLEDLLAGGDSEAMEAEDYPLGSIITALENLAQAPTGEFSVLGLARLQEFAHQLRTFRREVSGSVTDAITAAEHFLALDVETLVRSGWKVGRRQLDKFMDEGAKFARNGGSLSAFLQWLKVADSEEGGLKPTTVEVSHAAVQILTIHHAKGAEWDVVAVPGLAEGNFPNSGKKSDIWTRNSGSLPVALRGDREQLIDFDFPVGGPTATEVSKSLELYAKRWADKHLEEELRLAYVAFTRARAKLFVTTSWFRTGIGVVAPSQLFQWVSEVDRAINPSASVIAAPEPTGENPSIANPKRGTWPRKNKQSEIVAKSAEIVTSATALDIDAQLSSSVASITPTQRSYLADAQALIAEIARRRSAPVVYLPSKLSVSTLISVRENPAELALSIRRPMPNHIDKYARQGTAFHNWIERRFTTPLLLDDEDLDPTTIFRADEIPLKELQQKWLASVWADRTPIAVEVPFETLIAGTVLRGRIDAVYKFENQYEIVDWKTGREKSGDDLTVAAIQLAMYRLAYSKLHQIPLSNVGASFYYVGSDQIVKPADLLSEAELIAIIGDIEQG